MTSLQTISRRRRATTWRPAPAWWAAAADRRPSTCGRSRRPSGVRERRGEGVPGRLAAEHEAHELDARRIPEPSAHARDCDLRGLIDGIAVDPSGDRWKRDRAAAEPGRHLERAMVAG